MQNIGEEKQLYVWVLLWIKAQSVAIYPSLFTGMQDLLCWKTRFRIERTEKIIIAVTSLIRC